MRNFFRIAKWEYSTHFKSRSFLFSTFVLPVLFSLLITLPVLFISLESEVSTKLYGIINMADKSYTEKLWGIPCNKIQAEWASQRIKNYKDGQSRK